MNERIQPSHLSRTAILYVRQSSMMQVQRNQESRKLQYAMRDRLSGFGWRDVEVIDEDLGKSAAGGVDRSGFQRLLSTVCLGGVGVVAAREMSRFARNSREWQHLIEMCRVVDTLLLDQETIYDARRGNDRLLLGLKGSLNEYELDILRMRSAEARREKARRGELVVATPAGYIVSEDGRIEKDPDRRVQEAIRLLFSKFRELGSIRQTLLWFQDQAIELPVRVWGSRGQTTIWRRPRYPTIHRIILDPLYAGTYRYGRTGDRVVMAYGVPQKDRVHKPRGQWVSELKGRHDAYISPEEFEQNQAIVAQNTNVGGGASPGAARSGQALLVGLLRCRRCGRKLTIQYSGGTRIFPRYACTRGYLDCGVAKCIAFGAPGPDQAVSNELLRVLEPAAIEASIEASKAAKDDGTEVEKALGLEIDGARYEVDRAKRQYDAVDPQNRLVAGELEKRWNDALLRLRSLEVRLEQQRNERLAATPPDPNVLAGLAENFTEVWNHPAADVASKKRIIRLLINEIVVDSDAANGEITLVIHWKGGIHTELRVRRRRRGENLHTSTEVVAAVVELAHVADDAQIAGILNRHGLQTGQGNRWSEERVTNLRLKRGIPAFSTERQRAEGFLNLTEAAAFLRVSARTLRLAAEKKEISARHPLPHGPWIFSKNDLQTLAAQELAKRAHGRRNGNTSAVPIPGQLNLFPSSTCPESAV
jgi:DNA invertase Pin-like site-specific DNA recombinase